MDPVLSTTEPGEPEEEDDREGLLRAIAEGLSGEGIRILTRRSSIGQHPIARIAPSTGLRVTRKPSVWASWRVRRGGR